MGWLSVSARSRVRFAPHFSPHILLPFSLTFSSAFAHVFVTAGPEMGHNHFLVRASLCFALTFRHISSLCLPLSLGYTSALFATKFRPNSPQYGRALGKNYRFDEAADAFEKAIKVQFHHVAIDRQVPFGVLRTLTRK